MKYEKLNWATASRDPVRSTELGQGEFYYGQRVLLGKRIFVCLSESCSHQVRSQSRNQLIYMATDRQRVKDRAKMWNGHTPC